MLIRPDLRQYRGVKRKVIFDDMLTLLMFLW